VHHPDSSQHPTYGERTDQRTKKTNQKKQISINQEVNGLRYLNDFLH